MIRHVARFLLPALAAGIVVAGCSGSQKTDADAIHQRFVEALADHDRETVEALFAPESKIFTDIVVARFAELKQSRAQDFALSPQAGAFVGVDALAVQGDEQVKTALSVWRFEGQKVCYQTQLVQAGESWQISQIQLWAGGPGGSRADRHCPDGID